MQFHNFHPLPHPINPHQNTNLRQELSKQFLLLLGAGGFELGEEGDHEVGLGLDFFFCYCVVFHHFLE